MLSLPIDIHLWPSTVVVINHYYLRPVADPQSSVLPRHHGAHHQHHLGVTVYSRYNPHGPREAIQVWDSSGTGRGQLGVG